MRLIDADVLMIDIGCVDAVKYGNETAEQQHNSYSTLMMYEIADYINDAETIDAVPVIRCKDCAWLCKDRVTGLYKCGRPCISGITVRLDFFCAYGERKKVWE